MVVLASWMSGAAWGCSLLPWVPMEIDAQRADGIGPQPPRVEVSVGRGAGGQVTPEGFRVSSCDELGWIELTTVQPPGVHAAVGTELQLVGGELPSGLWLPDHIVEGPTTVLHWIDGATDHQEPIDFTLQLTPYDEGGDPGEPVLIEIVHGGTPMSCSTGARFASSLWAWAWLPLVWRRRSA